MAFNVRQGLPGQAATSSAQAWPASCRHPLLDSCRRPAPEPPARAPTPGLLLQVLLGRDNSFARAIAQGNLEPGAPILKAAAYDLDVLQELSISLEQLAEFVAEVAPTAGGARTSRGCGVRCARCACSWGRGGLGVRGSSCVRCCAGRGPCIAPLRR